MWIWAFRASAHESGSFVVFPKAHALNLCGMSHGSSFARQECLQVVPWWVWKVGCD
jgi:hypothetical protein